MIFCLFVFSYLQHFVVAPPAATPSRFGTATLLLAVLGGQNQLRPRRNNNLSKSIQKK
jgi:hypothetical protein